MNFKRTLESYLEKERATNQRNQETTKTFFSAFMVATLGFSGNFLQDASQMFIPQPVMAAAEREELLVAPTVVIKDSCHNKEKELLGTFPKEGALVAVAEKESQCQTVEIFDKQILGEEDILSAQNLEKQREEEKKSARIKEIENMTKGHPISEMSEEIADLRPEIAALVVGIAKKESNWGKRSPSKQGKDCYNYWGFKGAGERGTSMGHACFADRKEAVQKISKRLEKLVDKKGTSKPSALVTTWKCGSSCAGHSKESVNKWVSDVNGYYTKVLALK